jgi:hypothetical protein
MKIQIDTINKTITIEEDINLHEFYEEINKLLPSGLWREFSLKMTKITEWKDPITVPSTSPSPTIHPWSTPNPTTPWTLPGQDIWYYTTSTTTGGNLVLKNGVFNVEY